MPRYDYDLGIIGGGAAGLTVASGAAQLGAKVLLLEKESVLGGDCLHFGCVPSKTLIKSANVYHQMKTAPAFGLPKVQLPPVDFKDITSRIAEVISTIQKHDSQERFCGLGVRVEFGSPAFTSPHSVSLHGKPFSAARWVLATGSRPAAPPIPGLSDITYLTNKEIFSLPSLPQSLLIIGGGPIAVEMAQAFNRLGSRVTLLQRSRQILSKEDPDMAGLVQATLQEEGVDIRTGCQLLRVEESRGRKVAIYQTNNGSEQRASGQELLVSLGRVPNLDGLGLAEIGVEYDRKGLKLDQRLRTTLGHIHGAGDATGEHQFTHAAGYEAGVVLANAVFRLPRKVDYTWLPWCTYCQPELASLGLNEKAAQQAGIKYKLFSEPFQANDRSLAEGNQLGKVKLLLDEQEKFLGVQILGPSAGELLAEWVAVAAGGVKLSSLAASIHPYPTLAEINKRLCSDVMAPKIFGDWVKKGLKLFFNLKGRACSPPEAE